jgi:polyphenol oxidase
MIRPPGWSGVAFSERSDGDVRHDPAARGAVSRVLGVVDRWGELTQAHGGDVVRVAGPGNAGVADAMWTTESGLPLAVFTADCLGVVLVGAGVVGVAHAGWRGAVAGVVANLRSAMNDAGLAPSRAAIGPGIGPCCFEVGTEVSELFADVTSTRWGTTSVDLVQAVTAQLDGIELWDAGSCTVHEEAWFSHRGDGTPERMASIGWLP